MTDIAKLDKNFDVDINITTEDTAFYDVKEHPFCLFGLIYEEGGYRRRELKGDTHGKETQRAAVQP